MTLDSVHDDKSIVFTTTTRKQSARYFTIVFHTGIFAC